LSLARKHYSRLDVQKEIIDFCRNRWAAAHYVDLKGDMIFRRYLHGKPLRISDAEDFSEIMTFNGYTLRSVYATANVYWKFKSIDEVYDLANIRRCSAVWDVDGELSKWRETLKVAKEIVAFLNDRGVEKSVFLKWSGNGCHIHVHEEAFSEDLLKKHHPLDLAYALVEYVNFKVLSRIRDILIREGIKVENNIDPARVFTSPLSFHRELNVICVCFQSEDIEEFTPEWINPSRFRHDSSWRKFMRGEADEIAEDAYKMVGGYPLKRRRRERRTISLDEQIMKWLWRFEENQNSAL